MMQYSTLLETILSLLQQAITGNTTEAQKAVYETISQIETDPQMYMVLSEIVSNCNLSPTIRKMAIIVFKNSLKRNTQIIELTQQQLSQVKTRIVQIPFECDQTVLKQIRSLISVLTTWNKHIDFNILTYLLSQSTHNQPIPQITHNLQCIKGILQDLRLQIENYHQISQRQLKQFIIVYYQYFTQFFNKSNAQIQYHELACLNLLIPHLQQNHQLINQYLHSYLLPLLSIEKSYPIIEETLQGIIQIISIELSCVSRDKLVIKKIFEFNIDNVGVYKKYLGLILELVTDNNCEDNVRTNLEVIVPKLLKSLVFTAEDEICRKVYMEQQINPYRYENDGDEGSEKQDGVNWSYTQRKLAILCLERVIINYPQQAWTILYPILSYSCQCQNLVDRECGALLIGIVFENTSDHLQLLQPLISCLIRNINTRSHPQILKSTSLESLGKLAYLITEEPETCYEIEKQLLACISEQRQQSVRQTAYLALDDLISHLEIAPKHLGEIVGNLAEGVAQFNGKSLYSILRVISTLFQRHSAQIMENSVNLILEQIYSKWQTNETVQSIMSPILECLVTIVSSKPQSARNYASHFFQKSLDILHKMQLKVIVIRAIDLVSSLIALNINQIKQYLTTNNGFHEIVYKLITCQSHKQIRNFALGMLGDICKVTSIPKYAQTYVKTIGSNIQHSNLVGSSNALTCLTDLLTMHEELAQIYGRSVMEMACKQLARNNLMKVYAFNFARVYGRIGNVVPKHGIEFLEKSLIAFCLGLRATQHQQLTDQSFKGLLKMVNLSPQAASTNFEYIIDSFICYPCKDEQVNLMFKYLLRSFRNSLAEGQWQAFLSKPIFLPAVARNVDKLSKI